MFKLFALWYVGNGAGGGGRVAVILGENYAFDGLLQAHGGATGGTEHGRPGTVYLEYDIGNDTHREVRVDNLNRGTVEACSYPTELGETNTHYDFIRVDLRQRACLRIAAVSIVLFLVFQVTVINIKNRKNC